MRNGLVYLQKARFGVVRFLAVAAIALVVGAGQGFGQEDSGGGSGDGSGGGSTTCGTTTWDLTAGQHINVGTVTVENDASYIYITYTLDTVNQPTAEFGTLHVWVGEDLANMPANPQGHPIPGQFCQADGGACADATGLTTYTFMMSWDDASIQNTTDVCGLNLYVVTHAEVTNVYDPEDQSTANETAYGGDTPGPDTGAWWFYGIYTVCCDFGNDETNFCQTAYAKGGYVWTTDKKSNPEGLPSLKLTKNRWGWAIKLTSTGETTYDIWAGAGLNKTSNGTLVGELTINWDGTDVTVTYTMFDDNCMEEVHVYAGDDAPTTIAPGQYGHIAEFDPNATDYSVTLPLADSNGGGVWIVAHAVVCNGCE